MMTLINDIKYAFRMLAKRPGFTAIALITLAIGIGANTAVFSVVNAVLLSPLPYKKPSQIIKVWRQQIKGAVRTNMNHRDFKLLREQGQVFENIAAYCMRRVYVQGIDRPRHVQAEEVSPSLFALLGVQPRLGRGFLPEEEQEGKDRVVILSDAFWKDYFGGSPEVLGKSLILDGRSYEVIGVVPADFRFPFRSRTPFWVPLVLESKARPFHIYCFALARLKPGVTEEQARARVGIVARRLVELYPANEGSTFTVSRLPDELFGDYRKMLLLLLGTTGFVLLIACSNVANLLLVRATKRHRELVVRLALGASRGRIMRQMLIESVALSVTAGLLGLVVTFWALKGLIGLCPAEIPRMEDTHVDTTVLLFTLSISVITGLVFGLIPAWKGSDVHLGQALKEGLVQSRGGRGWRRLRDSLVISQLGISLILLVGGALLVKSLIILQAVDLGFRSDHLLSVHVELPEVMYPEYSQRKAFFEQLLERVRSLPGIRAAAIGDWSGHGNIQPFSIEGRPPARDEERPVSIGMTVSPGFFETLGIRVLKGRTFTQADLPRGDVRFPLDEPIVIDEKLARDYFTDVDPIGQRIRFTAKRTGTVVGVVDSKQHFEDMTPAYGQIYMPRYRFYWYIHDLIIRTDGDPKKFVGALRAQISALDKEQAQAKIETVAANLDRMLAPRRFTTVLTGTAAGLALLLAAVGIYGLLQYSVTQQFQEIGIRMALGASGSDVLRGVLRQGLKRVLIGIAVGLAGALALSRVVTSLLYDVRPTDSLTLVGASVLLGAVALVACWFPARRAARIDPMEALRYE
jgi:putative ABC transport system permease protein